MEKNYEEVRRFLQACTALMEGKYVSAEAKISEVLQAIASSKELTELFTAVTQGFDYNIARRRYLRFPSEPGSVHGAVFLPCERKELLAFVFCLFVELDAGALKLDEFLLRYFYVDGSYTASYLMFAERVVRPFRDIVRDCFPAAARKSRAEEQGRRQEEFFSKAEEFLPLERSRLEGFGLRAEEAFSAEVLLSAMEAAVRRKDLSNLTALLTGYQYFLRYFGGESEGSAELFALAANL